jgi:hypothetical protein
MDPAETQRCHDAGAIHCRSARTEPGGDRLHIGALGQNRRPEIIVPDEGEDQHRKRRSPAHQRQHDKPEDLPLADAFDARRLDQFEGQRLDEIAHEQRAEPGLEGDVEQDQARIVL